MPGIILSFSDETKAKARELLESGAEMPHSYPPVACCQRPRCAYCRIPQERALWNQECPALLRCALEIVRTQKAA